MSTLKQGFYSVAVLLVVTSKFFFYKEHLYKEFEPENNEFLRTNQAEIRLQI